MRCRRGDGAYRCSSRSWCSDPPRPWSTRGGSSMQATRSPGSSSAECLLQKRVELPVLIERVQLVRAAHALLADEDLRDGAQARTLRQVDPGLIVVRHVDLLEPDALALQQALGAHAVGTVGGCVDFHAFHAGLDADRAQKDRDWAPSTTTHAPAIQLARGLHRNAMLSPASSAVPKRPKGISRRTKSAMFPGSLRSRRSHEPPGCRMLPGARESTRTPRGASSRACSCARLMSAALAAL